MYPDIESMLKWAYCEKAKLNISGPGMNKLCWKYEPPKYINDLLIGLSQKDRIYQAVNIVGIVNELDEVDVSYKELIRAEFGYEREDKDIQTLMIRIIGLLGESVNRRRGVRDIVLSYWGEKISQRTIRDHLKCSSNDVYKYKVRICGYLDSTRARSLAILHERFVKKGLIPGYNQTVVAGR